MFCPWCGDAMQDVPGSTLSCERGGMELSEALDSQFRRFYGHTVPSAKDSDLPFRVDGKWFCPACGVPTQERSPGDVRCPQCERSLSRFIPALVELHPHR